MTPDSPDLGVGPNRFQALIVDFGGVLTNPLQESLEAFATSLDIELQDLVRVMLPIYTGQDDPMVEGFETGQVDEADFERDLARRFEETIGKQVDAPGLVSRIFAGVHLEPEMLDVLVAARREGMKTALLSNSWGMSGYPRELLTDLFDVVIISGEVGLRKPDPAIFDLTIDRLSVPPTKCIFVDDHPGHLEPAQKGGMTTILHISPEQTVARMAELTGLSFRTT